MAEVVSLRGDINGPWVRTHRLVTPRRLDVAVKVRFFRHLAGEENPRDEQMYVWHILERSGPRLEIGLPTDRWKTSIGDYVRSARDLLADMQDGFDADHPIPIDPAGELLDGSHRLACAIALRVGWVAVERRDSRVWAPAWDRGWFERAGADQDEVRRLWCELREHAQGGW